MRRVRRLSTRLPARVKNRWEQKQHRGETGASCGEGQQVPWYWVVLKFVRVNYMPTSQAVRVHWDTLEHQTSEKQLWGWRDRCFPPS